MPSDFGKEACGREDAHEGHGEHGLFHLKPDLVLKVLGMREGVVVEDKVVG